MRDNIPVYHAADIFEDMDPDIVQVFWRTCKVSFGDAAYTLMKGADAYRLINEAALEVAEYRGVGTGFTTPSDLCDEGVFFAIRG